MLRVIKARLLPRFLCVFNFYNTCVFFYFFVTLILAAEIT